MPDLQSTDGVLISYYRRKPKAPIVPRFWSLVNIAGEDDCWNWQGCLNGGGYGMFSIGSERESAPRIAMQILLNRLLVQDEQVLHTCDNPPCVNPNHLFIGTNQDNMNDMFAKGRNAKGEKHGCAKLTEADVQKIRTLHKEWWSVKYLSKKFNVTRSTIYLIIHRKIWTHI